MIEPTIRKLVVVQTRVADATLADDRVFIGTAEAAGKRLGGGFGFVTRHGGPGGFAPLDGGGEIWTNRYVVPRHKPEAGNVDLHVVVPQPAFVPRPIVRLAIDHRAARVDRHPVGEDAVWTTGSFHDVLHRQVSKCFRPVNLR